MRDQFAAAYGRPFHRNIGQARDGGNDLDVGPFCVEVKIRKTLGTVYGWLQQAVAALPAFCERNPDVEHPTPLVVARQDGDVEPLVILRLSDFLRLTQPQFAVGQGCEAPWELDEPPPPCPATSYPHVNPGSGKPMHCMAGRVGHSGLHFARADGGVYKWA